MHLFNEENMHPSLTDGVEKLPYHVETPDLDANAVEPLIYNYPAIC